MKRYKQKSKSKSKWIFIGVAVIAVGLGASAVLSGGGKTKAVEASMATPDARNNQRKDNLEQMAAAMQTYNTTAGNLAIAIPAGPVGICAGTGARCKAAGLVDLMALSSKGYLNALPSDPVGGNERFSTGYSVGRDPSTGAVVFSAPRAEAGAVLAATVE